MKLWLLILLLCTAAPALAQNTIVLRSRVQLPHSRDLLIGDVAAVSGPDSTHLAALSLATQPPRTGVDATITLAEVRTRLEAEKNINLGRVTLSGATCTVRLAGVVTPFPVPAEPAASSAPAAGETVQDRIAHKIADILGVSPADLRLTYEDAPPLLDLSTTGRTIAVQPTGSGQRMPISVKVYEGDRLVASGSTRVDILVKREVVLTKSPSARGDAAIPEQLTTATQWLSPDIAPALLTDIQNSTFRARVDAGQVIERRHIEALLAVRKGDLVTVDCLTDTVVVSTIARAKQAGHDGDVIELQTLQSKRSFKARLNGPGRAVLVATTEDTQ